jgi:hypothetical protein
LELWQRFQQVFSLLLHLSIASLEECCLAGSDEPTADMIALDGVIAEAEHMLGGLAGCSVMVQV